MQDWTHPVLQLKKCKLEKYNLAVLVCPWKVCKMKTYASSCYIWSYAVFQQLLLAIFNMVCLWHEDRKLLGHSWALLWVCTRLTCTMSQIHSSGQIFQCIIATKAKNNAMSSCTEYGVKITNFWKQKAPWLLGHSVQPHLSPTCLHNWMFFLFAVTKLAACVLILKTLFLG